MSGIQHTRTTRTRAAEHDEAVQAHRPPLRPAVFRELPGALDDTVATPVLEPTQDVLEAPHPVAQRAWAA